MRFSAIAVTFAALAAQVTLTSAGNKLDCASEVNDCFEVVATCDGDYIEYCLQPKVDYDSTSTCKRGSKTYSHMNVYLNGNGVNLEDGILSLTNPEARCLPGHDASEGDECAWASSGSTKSCNLLDGFDDTPTPFGDLGNVGRKCGDTTAGLCVKLPHSNQDQIIFAVKDGSKCKDTGGDWTCNNPLTEGDGSDSEDRSDSEEGDRHDRRLSRSGGGDRAGDTCSCSGDKPACVYEVENQVCSPPTLPPTGGGANGDPHFKTWRGQHFDYHGECDLVLLHSSEFGSGLGLDVHIRTKLRRDMSYISGATVRIGKDILEVDSQGVYYFNGKVGAPLPDELSGFAFSHTQPTDKQHLFEVDLGSGEKINVKTYKDFVSVLIEEGQLNNFGDSVGLMGDFGQGRMIARDGTTVLDDANAFGQEWQVRDTEPTLFQRDRLPQYPLECTMPTPVKASQLRRRLAESSVDEAAAEKACAHWGKGKDDCVFDVLTTSDLEMALVGAY
jgi:hypothetical protein